MLPPYPHFHFYRFITRMLDGESIKDKIIVDLPCGSAYISTKLAVRYPLAQVYGADIDKDCIEHARAITRDIRNLSLECCDIGSYIDRSTGYNYFLLINSLFLLPDAPDVLKRIGTKLYPSGKIILIIPNIYSDNYKQFGNKNQNINQLTLDKESAFRFIHGSGFEILELDGLIYAPYFDTTYLDKFKPAKGLMLYICNLLNKWQGKYPSYWAYCIQKKDYPGNQIVG